MKSLQLTIMAAVEGRTGNPGVRNPKKKNSTSFSVKPGVEPRSQKIMGFRPTQSLEAEIERAVEEAGITKTEWLEQAARAYLNQIQLTDDAGPMTND